MIRVLLILLLLVIAGCTSPVNTPSVDEEIGLPLGPQIPDSLDSQVVMGIVCTPEQKSAEVCTMEYMPVCGYDFSGVQVDTYGNKCGACSQPDVFSYEEGACKVQCSAEQIAQQGSAVGCTREYMPVCGYNSDGKSTQTYSNKCEACAAVGVVEYLDGECN